MISHGEYHLVYPTLDSCEKFRWNKRATTSKYLEKELGIFTTACGWHVKNQMDRTITILRFQEQREDSVAYPKSYLGKDLSLMPETSRENGKSKNIS
jgi:hypothetical protein